MAVRGSIHCEFIDIVDLCYVCFLLRCFFRDETLNKSNHLEGGGLRCYSFFVVTYSFFLMWLRLQGRSLFFFHCFFISGLVGLHIKESGDCR